MAESLATLTPTFPGGHLADERSDLRPWLEEYRKRAGLDPLRAVLDAEDVSGLKNAYTDLVERVQMERALRGKRFAFSIDLGCGIGRLTQLLARRSTRVLAVDASEPMVRAAHRRGLGANITFATADVRDLPLRAGRADLVMACQVLIHMMQPADLTSVAHGISRALRPGGIAMLVEHISLTQSVERQRIMYRTSADLVRPFQEAGLTLELDRPIRKMPSLLVHWVRRRYLPQPLWRLAARLEPWHASTPDQLTTYRDHLLLLRRV
jgi:SAM-dependent methyltransferase